MKGERIQFNKMTKMGRERFTRSASRDRSDGRRGRLVEREFEIKDIDLHRTLIIMLKNKSEAENKDDDTYSSLVMDAANFLITDLVDEEHPSLEGHKDPPLRPTKPIRVYIYKRSIQDVAAMRRCSACLKNENKN
jgi:hypothetical protein